MKNFSVFSTLLSCKHPERGLGSFSLAFSFHIAFLPGPPYPLSLGWMRNQHLYKTPFYAWPTPPPAPNNPSLASSLKLGIHRRFIWDAALSVRTTVLGKSIRPLWMDSIEAFRHSKIQTSPGSFLTRSQHNWVCSQSALTKPAVAHTKLSLPQCCSPWLSLFVVSLEVLLSTLVVCTCFLIWIYYVQ